MKVCIICLAQNLKFLETFIIIYTYIYLLLGRSGNIVDANLHLLKVRVEEVRSKERLERCCVAEQGWNYAAYDSFKTKTDNYSNFYQEFVELLGVVGATFGLTISCCTLCLCLFSILLHLKQ